MFLAFQFVFMKLDPGNKEATIHNNSGNDNMFKMKGGF